MTLQQFQAEVLAACAELGQADRYGPSKVWIDRAYRAFARRHSDWNWRFSDFQAWLLAAHKAGLLELVRVDLAGATEPGRMQAAETRSLASTYHLIVAPPYAGSVKPKRPAEAPKPHPLAGTKVKKCKPPKKWRCACK